MVNGSSNFFVNLEHEYQFKAYCKAKSIEAFSTCLAKEIYPSRFHIMILGASEILYAPFTRLKKIYEIFLYIWNWVNFKKFDEQPLYLELSKIFSVILLQTLTPLASLAIRLTAAFSGIFKPRFALAGWKFAEEVEKLSYEIWFELVKEYDWKSTSKQVCEEIIPANAIHYLGFEQTRDLLQIDPKELENIETQVKQHFTTLLDYVFQQNLQYFQKLLCHFPAINQQVIEQRNYGYFLSPDIPEILLELSQKRQELPSNQNESDRILIQLIFNSSLTFDKIRRLFTHIDLNLQSSDVTELNLDISLINPQITYIKDLFSLYFEFGRAHFHLEKHNLLPYSRI